MAQVLTPEAQSVANDPTNAAIAKLESGGDLTAKNPNSTAAGLYQVTDATFNGLKRNYPNLPQLTRDEYLKDPEAQQLYQGALRAENQKALKKYGHDLTPTNEYIMHWAGAPKGNALLSADAEEKLSGLFSKDTLAKNRLSGDMTVAEFKGNIDSKMNKALGGRVTPEQQQQAEQKRLDEIYKQQFAAGNTANAPLTLDQKNKLVALDDTTKKIDSLPAGSPEQNIAIADGFKKDLGPNWTNAFISALFGNKEQSQIYITGGMNSKPMIGEAIVNGRPQQIWINSNQRGDTWFTDPKTGKRLNDNIEVLAQSPEASAVVDAKKKQISATGGAEGPIQTTEESVQHGNEVAAVTTRSRNLKSEATLINSIGSGTKTFGGALNTLQKNSPAFEAFTGVLNSVRGEKIDEQKLNDAMIKMGIKEDQRAEFANYIRSIATLQENDKSLKPDSLAPGANISGKFSYDGGAEGVNRWLINRDKSYALQDAYNDYYIKNRGNGPVTKIRSDFERSVEFRAIENQAKLAEAKITGKQPSLKDGDPVASFDDNGKVIIKKYKSNKRKGE
jgi:hypothetical protein